MFTPNTIVHLLNVPLTSKCQDTIDFYDSNAQAAYFLSRVHKSYTDFTFQRKDNIIRIPENVESVYSCNYVMYRNNNFSDKWFYAYIEKLEYINQNCTHVYIKTDVFQTWLFDFTLYPSFVVREHVQNDEIGAHTIPENLETGEFALVGAKQFNSSFAAGNIDEFRENFYCVVIMSERIKWFTADIPQTDSFLGGVANCAFFYACELDSFYSVIDKINENGQAAAVVSCIAVPKQYVNFRQLTDVDGVGILFDYSYDNYNLDGTENNYGTLDGYRPRNNKCFCYPYNFMKLVNGQGHEVVLKYEFCEPDSRNLFDNAFTVAFCCCANPAFIVRPLSYKTEWGANLQVEYNNFPQIPWNYDAFKNWIALNSNTLATSFIFKGANVAGAAINQDFSGALSGTTSIISQLASMADKVKQPETIRGAVNGNSQLYTRQAGVRILKFCVRYEYAKLIDSYFHRYGYKVNEIKYPQFSSRVNWNYIETRNVSIRASAPQEDIDELRKLFDSGLTVFHRPEIFGNFELDNPIK